MRMTRPYGMSASKILSFPLTPGAFAPSLDKLSSYWFCINEKMVPISLPSVGQILSIVPVTEYFFEPLRMGTMVI